MIVSGGQQRDSAIHIHVSILPRLPSHPGCHIPLSGVPCALPVLLFWFLNTCKCVSYHKIKKITKIEVDCRFNKDLKRCPWDIFNWEKQVAEQCMYCKMIPVVETNSTHIHLYRKMLESKHNQVFTVVNCWGWIWR